MFAALALLLAQTADPQASRHVSDVAPIVDPLRPVSRIETTGFDLQYWTERPCETRVELRQGTWPRNTFGHQPDGAVKIASLDSAQARWHHAALRGLQPGTRYYYRVWDPGTNPTGEELRWGAGGGWRREYAVSTLAPKGRKTIIHLPVKVLLMPNVVNVQSALADSENPAPLPPKMSDRDLATLRDEYAVSSRVFWVASGMRLWVDYHIVVDDRVQRWGPEPADAPAAYKGLPQCRMYDGKDFDGPGGGTWTYVDVKHPDIVHTEPVVEDRPYSGQIEQAFPQRWNPRTRRWDFYHSGGGTFGLDDWDKGTSTRSNFLGGDDTAWLATHEFHHGLESHGQFSLSNREDDRIVFDHPSPRYRRVRGDGSADENTWSTAGMNGEQWDVIAWWDRQITDAQWLRFMFGTTETVKDADEDGFPDDDPRLPLDEKRFGSSPKKAATDGQTNDLFKAMESIWAPGPLQPTWIKPPFQGIHPKPANPDSDGDGLPDVSDPYPLFPWPNVIVPLHAEVDGDDHEWTGVQTAAEFDRQGLRFDFRQAHDEAAYYGLIHVHGKWHHLDASFDGEGKGMFSGEGILGFTLTNRAPAPGSAEPVGNPIEIKPRWAGTPGLKLKAVESGDSTTIEFSFPNRGAGPWYWRGGGREIGVSINVFDDKLRGYSAWEPYVPFYARMIEDHGKTPLPAHAPEELLPALDGVVVLKPGDANLMAEPGWVIADGVAKHDSDDESALFVGGLQAKDFDLVALIEGKSDAVLGAYMKTVKKMTAGEGFVGFVGGYGNASTRLRLMGNELGDEPVTLTPGEHRVQLTRRSGEIWLLFDGKPVLFAVDPAPRAVIDRLAVIGGYGGRQIVHELRYRVR